MHIALQQLQLFPNMSRKDRTQERNKEIRKKFSSYDRKKYTLNWVLNQVAQEFYLDANTVYAIVKQIGRYRPTKQND